MLRPLINKIPAQVTETDQMLRPNSHMFGDVQLCLMQVASGP